MKTTTKKQNKTKHIEIPRARQFLLTYKSKDGEVKNHHVSLPITRESDRMTVYCFGEGTPKIFKFERIIQLREISLGREVKIN